MRVGGGVLILVGDGVEIYNIASAPDGNYLKAGLQSSSRLGGGYAGAWLGAQIGVYGGPWDVFGGSIVGGIFGSIVGEEILDTIFNWE